MLAASVSVFTALSRCKK